jgi:signal transduction histidine kinase
LRISIADDGVGVPDDFDEGIGVGATRERLEQLYGTDHRFSIDRREGGGTIVAIELPVRRTTDA